MSDEEKNNKLLEKRQKKWNDTHRVIDEIDYKQCSICHEWLPCNTEYYYVNKANGIDGFNPYCKECTKKKAVQWQQDNYERYQEWFTERNSIYGNDYYKDVKRKWTKENRDYLNEKKKEWNNNNPDKLKQYNQTRIQHKKHKISKKEWIACKEYFDNSCAYCGLHQDKHYRIWNGKPKKIDLHKEHVDDNGANDLSNCVPSCQSCNSSKHTFDFKSWYSEYEYFNEERLHKIYDWLSEDYLKYIKVK